MKPILYEKNETAFTSSGIGRLADCLECKVTQELGSGLYECDFSYPVTGILYNEITLGRIIAVTHDDMGEIEPFDIVAASRPINGVVSFHAVHISYRLTKYVTSGTDIVSNFAALAMFRRAVPSPIPFTFQNSLPLIGGTMGMGDGVPRNVREMIGGGEGSFLDTYGGEVSWSGFTVSFQSRIGQQRDFIIRYGVNMMNYTEEQDGSECYTMAVPYWKGNDTVIVGNLVDSGLTPYNRPTAVALDLSSSFEEEPTTADLEAKALQIMQSGQTNLPSRTINVDFVRLQDLEDYAGFTDLMTCELGDSIEVVFPMYGMQGVFRIVKVVWDVLRDRFESMTLGSLETTLAEALGISGGMTNVGAGGGGGSVVQFTQVLSSGTRIGVITIDGAATDIFAPQGGDTVTWNQILATGTKIAEVSINGTSTDVYAPAGGGGSGTKTAWFGTCPTAQNVAAKVVTTSSGDFSLTAGSIVFVKFTNRLYTANTTLNVDGTGAVTIKQNGAAPQMDIWQAGETIGFCYDGTNFEMIDGGMASTSAYGVTKLSSSVSDPVLNVAANSYAVKQAYDLANSKSEVSWTQTQTSGTKIAEIDINGTTTDVYAPAGGGGGGGTKTAWYGTCSTAAATAAKVVTLADSTGWSLDEGVIIGVKFTATNTASNPTLNVNSSGAKSVYYNSSVVTTSNLNKVGYANRITYFMYDGTNWVWMGWSVDDNTTYSSMTVAEYEAGTGTTARLITPARLKAAIAYYAILLSDRYTRSSAGDLNWTSTTEGDSKVIMKSALAFWNGAYSGTSSNLRYSNAGQIIGRNQICYANSRVDTFSNGEISIPFANLGITTGARPVGILLTPEYSSDIVMHYMYDNSSSNVVIRAWKAGTAYSGALRYFAVVFQNTWTSV